MASLSSVGHEQRQSSNVSPAATLQLARAAQEVSLSALQQTSSEDPCDPSKLQVALDDACVLGVQQRPLRCMSGRMLRRRMRLCGLDAWVQPEHSASLQSCQPVLLA